MKLIITVLGVLFFWSFLHGQEIQLEALGGPAGGTVVDFEINSAGHILAFQKYSGNYVSRDAGITWDSISIGGVDDLNSNSFQFYAHPNNDFYIFGRNVWRLRPGEKTAELLVHRDSISVRGLTIDNSGSIFIMDHGENIFSSDDLGGSWKKIIEGKRFVSTHFSLYSFDDDFLYFLQNEDSLRVETKLYRTDKNGDNLTEIYHDVVFNLIKTKSGKLIFLTYNGRVYRSDEDGSNRELIDFANAIDINFLENNRILIKERNAFFYSDDNGETWTQITIPFSIPTISSYRKVRYNQIDSLYYLNLESTNLINFFQVSSDFIEWKEIIPDSQSCIVQEVTNNSQGELFISTHHDVPYGDSYYSRIKNIYKSIDFGNSFNPILINNEKGIRYFESGKGDLFYALSEDYILYKTENGGLGWSSIQHPDFSTTTTGQAKYIKSGRDEELLYMNTDGLNNKLYFSKNKGDSWDLISQEHFDKFDLLIHPEGNIYALGSQNTLLIRFDVQTMVWDTIYKEQGGTILTRLNCTEQGTIMFRDNGIGTVILSDDEFQSYSLFRGDNVDYLNAFSLSTKNNSLLVARGGTNSISLTQNLGLSWDTIYLRPSRSELISSVFLDEENYLYVSFKGNVLHKSIEPLQFNSNFIIGNIHLDQNQNCLYDSTEKYIPNVIVTAAGQDTFFVNTRSDGYFNIPVPEGIYDVTVALADPLWEPCDSFLTVSLLGVYDTAFVDFAVKPKVDCPLLEVNMTTPRMRRCFENKSHVYYCNNGTIPADSAYIEITLDPRFQIDTASISWNQNTAGNFIFDVGTIDVFECGNFWFSTSHECDSVDLGETICAEAHIYPDSICGQASPLWSGASLELTGTCDGDSLRFKIKNIGTGDMTQPRNYIIIEDVAIMRIGDNPFQLPAGGELSIAPIEANGGTIHVEVPQVDGHPGNSQPSLTVEGCGQMPHVLGLFNQFGQNDNDPFIDIECREVIGSYDPNDKAAVPVGLDVEHKIQPGRTIEYLIRFQNTGTDTAFTVNVIDTLSHWLDVTSFEAGASSHDYEYEISGQGTVRFKFNNILLPDSTTNEPASNGFIKYKIAMKTDIPLGAEILNDADIYFDYNDPIRTNETFHLVEEPWILVKTGEVFLPKSDVKVYPNPFSESAILELKSEGLKTEFTCRVFDLNGKLIWSQDSDSQQVILLRKGLDSGIYFYKLENSEGAIASGKLIVK